ncbi:MULTISPECIES: hypothetical protein [Rothia]|jgi:hypothetical protein|uniref:hypothetical protein n=1 Tax=Rothia TaxID=32207 RepID=UPI000B2E0011|nr:MULTISPECIES: hypothetical protein [Rothia]
MQQPYLSSPPESGGVPQHPAQASSQHADAHIPWRSSSALLTAPAAASVATVPAPESPERTFRVPHPVLSAISWVIAAASAAWLVILAVSLTMIVASGLSHDSEFVMLTYGVYMACAFGFCCFGTFFALHFGLGSSAHWRDSIRHPHHPH